MEISLLAATNTGELPGPFLNPVFERFMDFLEALRYFAKIRIESELI
jgi:hypothetical protein